MKFGKGKIFFVTGFAIVVTCIVSALVYSSRAKPVNQSAIIDAQKRFTNPYNQKLVDSAVQLLQTGDLVLRTGADITSYMFTQMNRYDKTYSHCGLIILENGYPFVYHSIGGEDNPDQRLKKDSANFWFSPANNLGCAVVRYDADSLHIHSVSTIIRKYYNERKKFDMDFDLATDDRLYCAEFVYKVMNHAMSDSLFIKPEKLFGYTFVGVDNLFLNGHARFICQVRYK